MYPLGIAIQNFALLLGVVCAFFATALPLPGSVTLMSRNDQYPGLQIVQFKLRFLEPIDDFTIMERTRALVQLDHYFFRMAPAFARFGFMPNIDPTRNIEGVPHRMNNSGRIIVELTALEERHGTPGSERRIEDAWYNPRNTLHYTAPGLSGPVEAALFWDSMPKIMLSSAGLRLFDENGHSQTLWSGYVSDVDNEEAASFLHNAFHRSVSNAEEGPHAPAPEAQGNSRAH